jgi:hypothetical protein
MTLHQIIKSLQLASGSLAKQAIMTEHKDNELFKEFMRITYDPAINFWQSSVPKSADWDTTGNSGMNIEWLAMLVDNLANRKVTGASARIYLGWYNHVMDTEHRELLKLIIDRSIGASVGTTMVLKTWPKLFFVPPYMRCSLVSEKTLRPFNTGETFVLQKKADGQYCSLYTSRKAYTRAGNAYPDWLVSQLLTGQKSYISLKRVILGEVLVCEKSSGNVLNRQVGNGLINSALKGADFSEFKDYEFFMECWDMLTEEEFERGYSEISYDRRFKDMTDIVEWEMENVLVIQTYFINTMEEAHALNGGLMCEGFEGSVIKTLTHKWRSHTSPFNVKLKVVFEIDLEIYAVNEGTGKAAGMMGSVSVKSREGILKSDVGTGFSDKQRKEVWENRDSYVGTIVALKANDILSNLKDDSKSLFLPVALEFRLDKTVSDTYDECVAQLQAAKGIA